MDAEHASLRLTPDLRREAAEAIEHFLDELEHRLAHLVFVLVAMGLEPRFVVVRGKLSQEPQRRRRERHCRAPHELVRHTAAAPYSHAYTARSSTSRLSSP